MIRFLEIYLFNNYFSNCIQKFKIASLRAATERRRTAVEIKTSHHLFIRKSVLRYLTTAANLTDTILPTTAAKFYEHDTHVHDISRFMNNKTTFLHSNRDRNF